MISYLLRLIWQVVITNPIKISTLTAAIICYNYAGSFKNSTYKEPVVFEYDDNSTWIYLIRSQSNSSGYDIMKFASKQKLTDGCLVLEDYNDFNILFWVLFSLLVLYFLINVIMGWVTDDDDISWDLYGCQSKSINDIIYCDTENGKFYYMALGRLVGESGVQINPQRVSEHFNVHSLSDLRKCPKFCTKKQNRNNLLNKLGIN
jgi:hypothetical protein